MAKSAVEFLCAEYNRSEERIKIEVSRLLRFETGQIRAIIDVPVASSLDTLFALILRTVALSR